MSLSENTKTDENPSEYLLRRWEIIAEFEQIVYTHCKVSPRSLIFMYSNGAESRREVEVLEDPVHIRALDILRQLHPDDLYWNITPYA